MARVEQTETPEMMQERCKKSKYYLYFAEFFAMKKQRDSEMFWL